MTRAALAAEKSVTVGVDRDHLRRRQARALGVGNSRLLAAGVFTAQRQLDCLVGRQRPGVMQVEIRQLTSHQLGRRQARCGVLSGVVGDRDRLLHGGTDRRVTGIRGGGVALALTDIHRDGNALIARELDTLGVTEPHTHTDTLIDARPYFAGIGARAPGVLERHGHALFQARLLLDGIESLTHLKLLTENA
ncbi:hypothetical protein GCM10009038_32650 [Salinicola rhizosphaerae]|uniref:Uncharacterized protein n=1 Tax=Salinicola rhizosphaerae TaxID=1443141 RepID=A0ABQ3EDF9_9GAMM|nr:hypothetical protein GCM10009038_32650 [Salinicola rhizosphaerae]